MASKYRQKADNFLYSIFNKLETVGEYSMPVIKPINDAKVLNLLTYNFAKTCQSPEHYHICFYIDDYQFERIWNEPVKSLELLKKFKGIIAPDFSLFRDFPRILNIYNCWRNKVLTAFYQMQGLEVIPNVTWSDESSYRYCFDGLPKHSIVAISTNGCAKEKLARKLFLNGYYEMKRRLEPTKIIIVGALPKELENESDIIHFEGYSTMINERAKKLVYGGDG